MKTVRMRCIDPNLRPPSKDFDGDALHVPALADVLEDGVVRHGDVVEVPAGIAGEASEWRKTPAGHVDPSGFFEYRGTPESPRAEFYFVGHGLLAQPGVWELEKPAKPTATATGQEG